MRNYNGGKVHYVDSHAFSRSSSKFRKSYCFWNGFPKALSRSKIVACCVQKSLHNIARSF